MGIAVQGGLVPFYDYVGRSPTFNATRDALSAQREGHIDWANIDALIAECTPAVPSLPGLYPGSTVLYVESLDIKPIAEERSPTCGNVVSYSKADVTIKYGKLPYNPETLITRKWNFSGEFMTLPASSVKWENGDAVENEEISAAKNIRMIEHALTRQRAVSIPWTAMRECIGKVNSALLDDDIFDNVAAESLLYLGSAIDWTLDTAGNEQWTLEHRFQERLIEHNGVSYGWCHFWRPDKKAWERLVDNAGNHMYESTADMPDLFD